jgi:hypothetical protein
LARSARIQLSNAATRGRARSQALGGRQAVDLAFDSEERVDAFDGLQSDRRDRRRVLAAPCIGGDVRQLEELAPRVAPAQSFEDRAGLPVGEVEPVVASNASACRTPA